MGISQDFGKSRPEADTRHMNKGNMLVPYTVVKQTANVIKPTTVWRSQGFLPLSNTH